MEILVGCDVGGTFTDFAISVPARGAIILHKVPSTSRAPDQAIIDGIGMRGKDGHTAGETADLSQMPVPVKRMALTMYRIAREAKRGVT